MSRLEWIFSGLLALAIVALVIAALIFWGPGGSVSLGSDDGSLTPQTAQSAYRLAEDAARQWSDDAQLLRAQASWPEGRTFAPSGANWGFLFTSSRQAANALFSVTGGQVRLVRTSDAGANPQPAHIEAWQVDSDAVLQQVMANGGQAFVDSRNRVILTMVLDATGQLQWQARLVDLENQEIFTMQLDPISGAIVATSSPGGE